MTDQERDAIRKIQADVGLAGTYSPATIDAMCREAASARARQDWPVDLNWRTTPATAAKRLTIYLNSFRD